MIKKGASKPVLSEVEGLALTAKANFGAPKKNITIEKSHEKFA